MSTKLSSMQDPLYELYDLIQANYVIKKSIIKSDQIEGENCHYRHLDYTMQDRKSTEYEINYQNFLKKLLNSGELLGDKIFYKEGGFTFELKYGNIPMLTTRKLQIY